MLMSGQHTASGGIFSDGAVSEPPGKSWQWLIMNLDKFDHNLTSRSQWNVGLFGIILKWPHLRLVNDYDSPGNECPSLNCHQLVVKSQHVWAHPVGQAGVRIIFQIFLMVGDLNITLVVAEQYKYSTNLGDVTVVEIARNPGLLELGELVK